MKINGSSWKFALLFFTGILIAAQLLFIIHWRWSWQNQRCWKGRLPSNWVAIDNLPAEKSNPSLKASVALVNGTSALVPPKPVIQELICPRNQKVQRGCYVVMDGPSSVGSGFSRFLVMEPVTQLTLGEVALKFPLHHNFTRENARQWPVIAGQLPMDLQKMVVAQPFLTQSFYPALSPSKVPEGKKRHILCLGLRASAVNNYFANLSTKYDVTVVEPEPALRYIAEKWLGYEETEHHRIFVENPAFYVVARARLIDNPNTVKVPKLFNFISVDVCYGLGTKTPGKCPISEFEDERVVSALAKNLAEKGTIGLHFYTDTSKSDQSKQHQLANHEHKILQLFKKYFTNCYFLGFAPHLLLTCTRSVPMTRASYIMALRKLPKDLQMYSKNQEPKFFLDLEAV